MIHEWVPFSFSQLTMEALLEPKVTMWFLGVVLLLVGARFYQLLIMAPGFAIGALSCYHLPNPASDSQYSNSSVLPLS